MPTEVTLGLWCPHCALPAAVEIELTAGCEHGWHLGRRGGLGRRRWCTDCLEDLPLED
jgi:hypothetical protein